jgi:hypothetical protein
MNELPIIVSTKKYVFERYAMKNTEGTKLAVISVPVYCTNGGGESYAFVKCHVWVCRMPFRQLKGPHTEIQTIKASEFRVICVNENCIGGETEMNIKGCGGEIVY